MDKWIDGFEMGMCCFEKSAKEFVHISNGNCTRDHKNPEAYKASHYDAQGNQLGCLYAPSEAIAMRVVGVTKTKDPIVAFTYRAVNPAHLEPSKKENDPINYFDQIRKSRFIGRV